MKKKRKVRETGAKEATSEPFDLDSGYRCPFRTAADITPRAVFDSLRQSRYLQILVLLTVAGAFLRFYRIGSPSLWLDEALTYQFSQNPFAGYWALISAGGEVHPPLFYWLEFVMLAFGHTETMLRFLPAIFGILGIPAIYLLGSRAVDRNTGILAAGLLAFSPFHVFYSQEARMYSLLLLFLTLALYFCLRASRTKAGVDWVLFGAFSALSFWTHFYAALPVAGAMAWHVARQARGEGTVFQRLKGPGISIVVFLAASLPVLWIAWTVLLGRTAAAPTWGNQGLVVITTTLNQFAGYSDVLAVLFLALFLIGLFMLVRTRMQSAVFITWLVVLVSGASILLSFTMPMAPRYLIGILPLFLVGVASSCLVFSAFTRDRRAIPLFLLVLILLNVPGLVPIYAAPQKEDWRGLATLMAQSTTPGDMVVVMPGYLRAPFDFYYSNATDGTRELGLASAAELQALRAGKSTEKIFIAFTDDLNAADPSGEAVRWLQGNAQYAGEHGQIYVFVVP